jgi:hypothetical protein
MKLWPVVVLPLLIGGCGRPTASDAGVMEPAAERALELGGFVLAHAIWKADGEPGEVLVPFSVTESESGRTQQVYAADRIEKGVEEGLKKLNEMQPQLEGWAFAYAGTERPSGADLVVVQVWRTGGFEAKIVQRYKQQPFSLDGEPEIYVDHQAVDANSHRKALMKGIDQHEKARHYWRR